MLDVDDLTWRLFSTLTQALNVFKKCVEKVVINLKLTFKYSIEKARMKNKRGHVVLFLFLPVMRNAKESIHPCLQCLSPILGQLTPRPFHSGHFLPHDANSFGL